MGGKSPSQGAVLRDGKTQTSSGFDLHSWQGLTEVLKVGKETLRDPSAYAEFRNLVLQYAQQGGDVELRKQIDATISTFRSSENSDKTVPVPPSTPQESPRHKPNIPPQAIRKPDGAPRRAPLQFNVQVKRVPKEVALERNESAKNIPLPPTPRKETPPPVPGPIPEPMVAFKSLEEYRARIGVIKRFVNAHIGNPATLIDTHNELGKTYMSALLAALKATGGGGAPDVDAAMINLESAYANLVSDLKRERAPGSEQQDFSESKERTPNEEEVLVVTQKNEAEPRDTVVAEPIPEPEPPPEPTYVPPPPPPKPKQQAPAPVKKASAGGMLASLLTHEEPLKGEQPIPQKKMPESSVPPQDVPEELKLANAVWNSQGKHALRGIGKTHEETLKRETGIDPANVAVKQTELSAPGITSALHELLHEWSIFKGSGLFGLGPAGAEHPLYQKLSGLTMGEVAAGRYEDSDPKVTKVIKQYVDAWRHEQGIAYNINETFEHYLRRVVQRILKRQNS